MNTAGTGDVRWSPQRWVFASVLIIGLHVGALFLLSPGAVSEAAVPESAPRISLLVDRSANDHLLDGMAASDPVLLALVNPHGFSGSRWVNYPPPEHRPTDWSEPERWLNQSTSLLTISFSRYVATNAASVPLRAEKPIPPPASISLPPQVLAMESTVRVEGQLAPRPLVGSLKLPSWSHTNLLADSRVQVLVDGAGYTHSAVLVSPVVSKDPVQGLADQYALNWAKTNRFQPLAGRPQGSAVVAGTLVFQWQTLPPESGGRSSEPP